MYRSANNLKIVKKGGRQFATFDVWGSKASVEKVACLIDGAWLDIDNGHDWTESVVLCLSEEKERKEKKKVFNGLRQIYESKEAE